MLYRQHTTQKKSIKICYLPGLHTQGSRLSHRPWVMHLPLLWSHLCRSWTSPRRRAGCLSSNGEVRCSSLKRVSRRLALRGGLWKHLATGFWRIAYGGIQRVKTGRASKFCRFCGECVQRLTPLGSDDARARVKYPLLSVERYSGSELYRRSRLGSYGPCCNRGGRHQAARCRICLAPSCSEGRILVQRSDSCGFDRGVAVCAPKLNSSSWSGAWLGSCVSCGCRLLSFRSLPYRKLQFLRL